MEASATSDTTDDKSTKGTKAQTAKASANSDSENIPQNAQSPGWHGPSPFHTSPAELFDRLSLQALCINTAALHAH